MNVPENMTATQLAARWGVSNTFVYDLLHTGQLPGFKLGPKLWRIRLADVVAYEGRDQ